MKRPVVTALVLCAVATLAGCPIYDHQDAGCYRTSDCAPGYVCDDRSGDCFLPGPVNGCARPEDCGVNQTCSKNAECVAGDCTFAGCVSGYECDSSSGIWSCVLNGSAGAGNAGAAGTALGASGAGGQAGSP